VASFVSVVDDDESVRESLPDMLRAFGLEVDAFPSARAFLASDSVTRTQCLILDVAMPDMTGLELHAELSGREYGIPIIFISAHLDDRMRSRVLDGGAIDCLSKPFSEAALLSAVDLALKRRE
jgi:FixJ family two-component response regulator